MSKHLWILYFHCFNLTVWNNAVVQFLINEHSTRLSSCFNQNCISFKSFFFLSSNILFTFRSYFFHSNFRRQHKKKKTKTTCTALARRTLTTGESHVLWCKHSRLNDTDDKLFVTIWILSVSLSRLSISLSHYFLFSHFFPQSNRNKHGNTNIFLMIFLHWFFSWLFVSVSIGGAMGLFLGASILSIVEFFYFFIFRLIKHRIFVCQQ